MLIFKIALKNVFAHKAKTIIIGLLLVVAMVVMVVGNSLMDTAKKASEDAWIKCYAGDLMIRPAYKTQEMSVLSFLFGGGNEPVRPVAPFMEISAVLKSDPAVLAYSPQVVSWERYDFAQSKYSGGITTGIDPLYWQKTFPDAMDVLEGRFLKPGEEGIMLSWDIVKQVREVLKLPVTIGQKVTITAAWGSGTIRDVELVGIYRFRTGNRFFQMSSFVDLKTARKVSGFGLANDKVEASAEASLVSTSLAEGASLDDLFGDDFFEDGGITISDGAEGESAALEFSAEEKAVILANANEAVPDASAGDFHFVLVRLREGADTNAEKARLDALVKAMDPSMEVVTWYNASAGFVHMTEIVRLVFIILVIVLCAVTAFVITNALMISVAERTVEIGTMRALGAQKNFVSTIFVTESMILSLGFGLLGIVFALAILGGLGAMGLHFPDAFMAAMFGSSQLNPVLSVSSVFISLGILCAVGFAASLYPTRMALRLRPVEALGRSA